MKLLGFVILDKANITGDKLIEIHWETSVRHGSFKFSCCHIVREESDRDGNKFQLRRYSFVFS